MKNRVVLLKGGTRKDYFVGDVRVSEAICSAVVLVQAGGKNLVVDPGAMGCGDEVLKRLKSNGVKAADVDVIVNTHLHFDHTYNNHLFPNAVIYTPTSVWYPDGGNRVELHPVLTDPRIPGVRFISTPGHMEKHISVVVERGGKKIVIAGDAVREDIINKGDASKYANPAEYFKSMKRIFDVADEIIPGHGPVIKGEKLRRLRAQLKRTIPP